MDIYVVRPGDSIYTIARRYGMSPQRIIDTNELSNPGRLVVGQSLVILPETRTYTVQPGDSLYTIARRYSLTPADLIAANPDVGEDGRIYPGQTLTIPPARKLGSIEVNGYAFPNIDRDVLNRTLPSLTYLSIFSYTVNDDGSLNSINDTELIAAARAANVAPIMVLTNIREGEGFDSDLAHTMLTNQAVQDTMVQNILNTLREKNYYGLNLDIEYVHPYDRESFNQFVRRMSVELDREGYFLMTSLAPKISADQPGVLYEAHDYPVQGALNDRVILMTYEWGYTAGPPLPVAPLNEVRRVLNYAATAIPGEKILMGMPNYGYDWTLPYTPGTRATTIGNTAAVERAANVNAAIQFDARAQSPFFTYYDEQGRQHIVWFEDARSIYAKLQLVEEYNLAGVSYWTIGRWFPENWLLINALFDVVKVL